MNKQEHAILIPFKNFAQTRSIDEITPPRYLRGSGFLVKVNNQFYVSANKPPIFSIFGGQMVDIQVTDLNKNEMAALFQVSLSDPFVDMMYFIEESLGFYEKKEAVLVTGTDYKASVADLIEICRKAFDFSMGSYKTMAKSFAAKAIGLGTKPSQELLISVKGFLNSARVSPDDIIDIIQRVHQANALINHNGTDFILSDSLADYDLIEFDKIYSEADTAGTMEAAMDCYRRISNWVRQHAQIPEYILRVVAKSSKPDCEYYSEALFEAFLQKLRDLFDWLLKCYQLISTLQPDLPDFLKLVNPSGITEI